MAASNFTFVTKPRGKCFVKFKWKNVFGSLLGARYAFYHLSSFDWLWQASPPLGQVQRALHHVKPSHVRDRYYTEKKSIFVATEER